MIKNVELDSAKSVIEVPAGNVYSILGVYICNPSADNSQECEVSVISAGSDIEDGSIIKKIPIEAKDTFYLEQNKFILDAGEKIYMTPTDPSAIEPLAVTIVYYVLGSKIVCDADPQVFCHEETGKCYTLTNNVYYHAGDGNRETIHSRIIDDLGPDWSLATFEEFASWTKEDFIGLIKAIGPLAPHPLTYEEAIELMGVGKPDYEWDLAWISYKGSINNQWGSPYSYFFSFANHHKASWYGSQANYHDDFVMTGAWSWTGPYLAFKHRDEDEPCGPDRGTPRPTPAPTETPTLTPTPKPTSTPIPVNHYDCQLCNTDNYFNLSDPKGLFLKNSYKPNDKDNTILFISSDTTDDGSKVFNDSSPSHHSISAVGDTQHKTDKKKFGSSSIYFDGEGDYLSVGDTDSPDWDFGSEDWTMEAWVRPTANYSTIMGKWNTLPQINNSFVFWVDLDTHKIRGYFQNDCSTLDSNPPTLQGNTALTLDDKFYHVAVQRNGDSIELYINGVFDASVNFVGSMCTSTIPFMIGDFYPPTTTAQTPREYKGHIDNVRVTKSRARYTPTSIIVKADDGNCYDDCQPSNNLSGTLSIESRHDDCSECDEATPLPSPTPTLTPTSTATFDPCDPPQCCANGKVLGAGFTLSGLNGTWYTNGCSPLVYEKEGFYRGNYYMTWNGAEGAWQVYEDDWYSSGNEGNIVAQSISGTGHSEFSYCPFDTTWKETIYDAASWNNSLGTITSGCLPPDNSYYYKTCLCAWVLSGECDTKKAIYFATDQPLTVGSYMEIQGDCQKIIAKVNGGDIDPVSGKKIRDSLTASFNSDPEDPENTPAVKTYDDCECGPTISQRCGCIPNALDTKQQTDRIEFPAGTNTLAFYSGPSLADDEVYKNAKVNDCLYFVINNKIYFHKVTAISAASSTAQEKAYDTPIALEAVKVGPFVSTNCVNKYGVYPPPGSVWDREIGRWRKYKTGGGGYILSTRAGCSGPGDVPCGNRNTGYWWGRWSWKPKLEGQTWSTYSMWLGVRTNNITLTKKKTVGEVETWELMVKSLADVTAVGVRALTRTCKPAFRTDYRSTATKKAGDSKITFDMERAGTRSTYAMGQVTIEFSRPAESAEEVAARGYEKTLTLETNLKVNVRKGQYVHICGSAFRTCEKYRYKSLRTVVGANCSVSIGGSIYPPITDGNQNDYKNLPAWGMTYSGSNTINPPGSEISGSAGAEFLKHQVVMDYGDVTVLLNAVNGSENQYPNGKINIYVNGSWRGQIKTPPHKWSTGDKCNSFQGTLKNLKLENIRKGDRITAWLEDGWQVIEFWTVLHECPKTDPGQGPVNGPIDPEFRYPFGLITRKVVEPHQHVHAKPHPIPLIHYLSQDSASGACTMNEANANLGSDGFSTEYQRTHWKVFWEGNTLFYTDTHGLQVGLYIFQEPSKESHTPARLKDGYYKLKLPRVVSVGAEEQYRYAEHYIKVAHFTGGGVSQPYIEEIKECTDGVTKRSGNSCYHGSTDTTYMLTDNVYTSKYTDSRANNGPSFTKAQADADIKRELGEEWSLAGWRDFSAFSKEDFKCLIDAIGPNHPVAPMTFAQASEKIGVGKPHYEWNLGWIDITGCSAYAQNGQPYNYFLTFANHNRPKWYDVSCMAHNFYMLTGDWYGANKYIAKRKGKIPDPGSGSECGEKNLGNICSYSMDQRLGSGSGNAHEKFKGCKYDFGCADGCGNNTIWGGPHMQHVHVVGHPVYYTSDSDLCTVAMHRFGVSSVPWPQRRFRVTMEGSRADFEGSTANNVESYGWDSEFSAISIEEITGEPPTKQSTCKNVDLGQVCIYNLDQRLGSGAVCDGPSASASLGGETDQNEYKGCSFTFRCKTDGTCVMSSIWGGKSYYSSDSNLCMAVKHKFGNTAAPWSARTFKATVIGCKNSFSGSTSNHIESYTWGPWRAIKLEETTEESSKGPGEWLGFSCDAAVYSKQFGNKQECEKWAEAYTDAECLFQAEGTSFDYYCPKDVKNNPFKVTCSNAGPWVQSRPGYVCTDASQICNEAYSWSLTSAVGSFPYWYGPLIRLSCNSGANSINQEWEIEVWGHNLCMGENYHDIKYKAANETSILFQIGNGTILIEFN